MESLDACESVGYPADVCVTVPLGDPSMTRPLVHLNPERKAPGNKSLCGINSLLGTIRT